MHAADCRLVRSTAGSPTFASETERRRRRYCCRLPSSRARPVRVPAFHACPLLGRRRGAAHRENMVLQFVGSLLHAATHADTTARRQGNRRTAKESGRRGAGAFAFLFLPRGSRPLVDPGPGRGGGAGREGEKKPKSEEPGPAACVHLWRALANSGSWAVSAGAVPGSAGSSSRSPPIADREYRDPRAMVTGAGPRPLDRVKW
jgi:hypothetical protein